MPATSSVVGSRAELAPLPWLLLVHLCVSAGAFKLGVVREEPFVKLFKLYPGPLDMQEAKLCIFKIAAFEINVERSKKAPKKSGEEEAQAVKRRGEECIESNLFFLHWSATAAADFWGGSAHVTIECNGAF